MALRVVLFKKDSGDSIANINVSGISFLSCLLFWMLQEVEVSVWRIFKTNQAPIVIQQHIETGIIICCWNLFIRPLGVMGRGATASHE